MPPPLVAIICPKEFTFSDPAAAVERGVLDGTAEVRTITLDFNELLPAGGTGRRMCGRVRPGSPAPPSWARARNRVN